MGVEPPEPLPLTGLTIELLPEELPAGPVNGETEAGEL